MSAPRPVLSERLERGLALALDEADGLGHGVVTCQHLLYALAAATTSADELLQSVRVTRDDIIKNLERLRSTAPSTTVRDEATHAYRLTLESAWLLSLAADFAKQFASSRVSALHLLIAM